MRLSLICFLFCCGWIFPIPISYAQTDDVFDELDQAIARKEVYDKAKRKRISDLRRQMGQLQEFYYNKAMYEEYRKFRLDSAIHYIRRNLELAREKNSKDFSDASTIQLANLYSSSGKYRESEVLLKSIHPKKISPEFLPDYYEAYSQFWEHYAAHSYEASYVKNIEIYRDSLLSVLDRQSLKYRINLAQKNIYLKHYDLARQTLEPLFKGVHKNSPDYAMVSYLLGTIFWELGDRELGNRYYAMSATADVKSAVKDNASVQTLALIYYEKGDLNRAYRYTKSAIDDAVFCNAKFRTIIITEFYSIINTAYQEKEARRNKELTTYLIMISVLSVLLIVAVGYVYVQIRKLSKIRSKLAASGQKLTDLNSDISSTNEELQLRNLELSEANHVKEAYIAQFFDMCSTYIDKLESYRKMLNKKATAKQFDDLLNVLKSNTLVENELDELYRNFDSIFLNLYPTFVEEFNNLLIADEYISLKPGELLNTELRIFALIRLGITDSVKIAAFLRYSLSTIYNYRTRARNKAVVSRDAFEAMVMIIGNRGAKT
ncbi:DUF6377 domain-containing protein [Flavobacterium selenitireducens]|uniref:DUF6377 domain-containing protein n=1 Tax=Flavobacterium selenitireducens TaxID=2722704 RepID=UPI00168B6557|nr:DUF6377 domain-containing protein [Flavobacterium selenitireducens]MBD3581723.1 hypothetical protein [Flavobacterium selenitireducens]